MPEPESTAVSGLVLPDAVSRAPFALVEFAQPRPAAPMLPQGQGVGCVPSPKQNGVPSTGSVAVYTRTGVVPVVPYLSCDTGRWLVVPARWPGISPRKICPIEGRSGYCVTGPPSTCTSSHEGLYQVM